ncbi:M16 family metallopeptidase [Acetohalobium arabaticum]|uniref:Peptidase M16 domain protein n=1 Tax=Acetohalobium arabaticum (strain ATCC 49924 / DSM 5501 / Z-7288) TaxID=574087 RepID=D9QR73_ACEAZ|nr:pitrilysin family protein [Acetohalobium arabaticum]ADL13014.1 peptidase M16 domain protein [Acetohalobium arabaticum DSM 5501]
MKKITLVLMLVVIISLVAVQTSYAGVDFDQELFKELAKNKNKIPKIDIPDYKRVELENGMIIYLVKNDELPIVELTGYIKGGRRQEKKDIAGISGFMFEMMNTGTKELSEQDFLRYKELHGIGFNFGVNKDYFKFSGNALSTDKEALISLTADILRYPKFDAEYFKRIKQEKKRSLAQAKTEEDSLLDMYFYRNLYEDHPYSFSSDLNLKMKALDNITPSSLQKFHRRNVAPNNIVLGIIGDIDLSQMEKLVREQFSDWSKRETRIRQPEIKENKDDHNKVILINKPDATQATIKMGYNFFSNSFEDKIPFEMANRVYGSGRFGSRLMENLRSEKGYVYSVYSRDNYYELGGDYYITTEVKPAKSDETIAAIKKEMLSIKRGKNKISEDELFKIINRYNALFPKVYNSKLSILNKVIYNAEIRDRKPNYMNEYIQEYNNLDAATAQKVFAEYTYPNRFLTVIVGKKQDILPEFENQGIDVEVVEIGT